MILSALQNDLALELNYSEHACECVRNLSPEVGAFLEELLFSQDDVHETKLLARHAL
jgi:hypothetical protein